MSCVRPILVHDRCARVVAHARRADQMRVAGLLHDFLGARRPHHFHRLILAELDQLLIVIVKIESDLRDGNAESIRFVRQLQRDCPRHGRISPSRPSAAQWL